MQQLDVDWKFWSKQDQCMEYANSGEYDITVFLGGYRSGKSVTGARWLVEKALENMNGHFLSMAVDYTKGKKTTYEVLFEEALPGNNLNPFKGGDPENSPIVQNWTKQDRALTFVNGATITLAGADEEGRYEGGSFNAVWMDEPGNYEGKLDGVAKTILERMDGGPPGTVMWTTTGKRGALQRIIEKRKWGDGSEIENSIKVVRASTENNPFLADSALERLKRTYKGSQQEDMALHGEFGEAEGMVYPQFKRETHVKPTEELEERIDYEKRWVFGYDAGWDDERVVLEAAIGHDGTILVLDEFYRSDSFVDDAIKYLNKKPKGVIHSEHEPEHVARFNEETKHKAVKAMKRISPGIEEVRRRFKNNGLLISEDCQNLIEELVEYEKSDVGGSNVQDHANDSLRYLCSGVRFNDVASGEVSPVKNPFAVEN